MTRVATCPQCAAQLSVPEPAAADAQASCPFCNAHFALTGVRTLRSVTLVEAPVMPTLGEPPLSSQVTLPDRLTDSPTLSTLFERFREIPRSEDNGDSDDADETPELADTVVSGASEKTRDPFDFDAGELGIERQANIEYQPHALEHTAPVIASSEPDPAARAFVAEVVSVAQAHKRRERGKGSLVRQIVGVVGGGAIGLTLGYCALLWWRGPDGDLLGIADRIPSVLLPGSFNATEDDTALASDESEPSPPPESPSEVEQATFTETTVPEPSAATEERAPRPLVPPDAQPLPTEAMVQNAPRYTLDELNAALAIAATARDGLLAGSLSDAAAKRTKGESYVKLCQIAETLTFLAEAGDADLAESRQSGRQFFGEALRDPVARDEIGQIADRWIDYANRPHGGIFFAGTIVASRQAGSVQELQLELVGGEIVVVLTPTPLDAPSGTIGVVGSIVEQPTERVTGYTGTADRAVWSPLAFAVE